MMRLRLLRNIAASEAPTRSLKWLSASYKAVLRDRVALYPEQKRDLRRRRPRLILTQPTPFANPPRKPGGTLARYP
jgi:hypothetical protein